MVYRNRVYSPRLSASTTLFLLATVLAAPGCAPIGTLPTRLRHEVHRPDPGVVLFLVDGAQADLVDRGCAEDWLPNIRRRFVAGGVRVENAVTVFPPITYSALTTFLTGVSPARHGIVGNRWYSPPQRLFRHYLTIANYRDVNGDFEAPTLYERLRPRFSTSIQAAVMRGATEDIANWTQSGILWGLAAHEGVDTLTAGTLDLVARRANARRRWPDLLTCYFPGLDTVGHLHGPGSGVYRAALRNVDRQIGRVCDWLEREGLLDRTYLVLVSDHGQVDVHRDGHVDLLHLLRDQWGRRVTDHMMQNEPAAHRRRFYDRFDTVIADHDGRKALLHFADAGGWDRPPAPEVVASILNDQPPARQLWNQPGVELVMYLSAPGEAILRCVDGQARVIERQSPAGPEYAYVCDPADPLGYLDDPALAAFVAEGFHPSRAWLAATCRAEVPDLVPHVVPLLRHRHTGQVIVVAVPGWSFRRERGGHGGMRRAERRMLMLLAGPGIAGGGTLECARAEDLAPTLLTLLGCELPQDGSLEGIPLSLDLPAPRAGVTKP